MRVLELFLFKGAFVFNAALWVAFISKVVFAFETVLAGFVLEPDFTFGIDVGFVAKSVGK